MKDNPPTAELSFAGHRFKRCKSFAPKDAEPKPVLIEDRFSPSARGGPSYAAVTTKPAGGSDTIMSLRAQVVMEKNKEAERPRNGNRCLTGIMTAYHGAGRMGDAANVQEGNGPA